MIFRRDIAMAGILLILSIGGCDDSLGPAVEPERPFTVYGYLNPRADTQAVRVFEIASRLEKVPNAPIDAEVVTIDVATGDVQAWRDSVVQMPAGEYRHVFWAAFRPHYTHTYRIEVRRSDGELSWAELSTPPNAEAELLDAEILPGTNVIRQAVRWHDAPLIHDVEMNYHRAFFLGGEVIGRDTVIVSYLDARERLDDGWEVEIDYWKDAAQIRAPSSIFDGSPILMSVEMSALVADSAWLPRGGEFDPDEIINPGSFSNVRNGYGFVGGGYPTSIKWMPDEEILQRLGIPSAEG